MTEPSARVLSGYKEIACFLGVSVRTMPKAFENNSRFQVRRKDPNPGERFSELGPRKSQKGSLKTTSISIIKMTLQIWVIRQIQAFDRLIIIEKIHKNMYLGSFILSINKITKK